MEVNYPFITILYDPNIFAIFWGFPWFLWLTFAFMSVRGELLHHIT